MSEGHLPPPPLFSVARFFSCQETFVVKMGSFLSRGEEEKAKEHAISKLQSAYVMLAPSSLEGVGVFAMRDIPEGVEVMRWDW